MTPFDPRVECRKSFHEYKFDVLKMYKELGEDVTTQHIKQVRYLYSEPRVAQEIKDLIPKQILVKFEGVNEVMNGDGK